MGRPSLVALSRNMHRSLRAEQAEKGFQAVARHSAGDVLALLNAGLDPNAVPPTPADLALSRELTGEASRYRSRFENERVRDRQPLLLAAAQELASQGNDATAPLAVFRMLLSRGADIRGSDANGNTVLHLLASCRQAGQSLAIAVQAGASPLVLNRKGATAFHALAASAGSVPLDAADIAPWLALGLDPNASDRDGRTPLDAALASPGIKSMTVISLVAAGCRWTQHAACIAHRLCTTQKKEWEPLRSSVGAYEFERLLPAAGELKPPAPTRRPRL